MSARSRYDEADANAGQNQTLDQGATVNESIAQIIQAKNRKIRFLYIDEPAKEKRTLSHIRSDSI